MGDYVQGGKANVRVCSTDALDSPDAKGSHNGLCPSLRADGKEHKEKSGTLGSG